MRADISPTPLVLVDDEPGIRTLFAGALGRAGFRTRGPAYLYGRPEPVPA